MEIVDLSQEIYSGMPVFKGLPEVKISMHVSHEEWDGLKYSNTITPAVNKLQMGEHSGTHVDALSHMSRANAGQSIDTMPLSMFYTEGICLDFSHKGLGELIEPDEMEVACDKEGIEVREGDTVLICTDHYRKAYGTEDWSNGPGISSEGARWFGEFGIAGFGVETMSPGVPGVSNKEVHRICGELGFTHYENMINPPSSNWPWQVSVYWTSPQNPWRDGIPGKGGSDF